MNFLVDSSGYISSIKPIRYMLKYDTLYMNRVPEERQVALKEQIKALMGEEGNRILSLMPQKWTPGSLFGKKYTDGAGAATDSTGHFVLWSPCKDVKLQASRVGYHTIRINQPVDTTLTIRMKDATKMKEVKVVPKATVRIRGAKP